MNRDIPTISSSSSQVVKYIRLRRSHTVIEHELDVDLPASQNQGIYSLDSTDSEA